MCTFYQAQTTGNCIYFSQFTLFILLSDRHLKVLRRCHNTTALWLAEYEILFENYKILYYLDKAKLRHRSLYNF